MSPLKNLSRKDAHLKRALRSTLQQYCCKHFIESEEGHLMDSSSAHLDNLSELLKESYGA